MIICDVDYDFMSFEIMQFMGNIQDCLSGLWRIGLIAVEQLGVFRYGPFCKYLDPSFCPIYPVNKFDGKTSSRHGHLARLGVLLSRSRRHFVPKVDVSSEAMSLQLSLSITSLAVGRAINQEFLPTGIHCCRILQQFKIVFRDYAI